MVGTGVAVGCGVALGVGVIIEMIKGVTGTGLGCTLVACGSLGAALHATICASISTAQNAAMFRFILPPPTRDTIL